MKKLIVLAGLTLITHSSMAKATVIYGQDDRKDVYQVSNPLHLKLAQSTAGMIHINHFSDGQLPYSYNLSQTKTLEKAQNVCPSEKFSQQKLAPICSGFLVGPDTLVTAGHCFTSDPTPTRPGMIPEDQCKNFAWVFDYEHSSPQRDPTKNISLNNIYLCKQVLMAERNKFYDYAIIKLDRPVVGRSPLPFRTSGTIANDTSLVVIGHPNGLPKKVTDNGKITFNSEVTRFSTTLDTFHGNSGAAVFDAKTGVVEGILIMGKNDYRPSVPGNPNSCKVVNVCDESGYNCSAGYEGGIVGHGEVVLRIANLADLIIHALKLE